MAGMLPRDRDGRWQRWACSQTALEIAAAPNGVANAQLPRPGVYLFNDEGPVSSAQGLHPVVLKYIQHPKLQRCKDKW